MCPQSLGRVKIARQFRFGQSRMDFTVADLVQQNGRTSLATFQLGDQMMDTLLCLWRDRPVAKWANWIGHRIPSVVVSCERMAQTARTSKGST